MRVKSDKRRDRRINEEILVDCYSESELAPSWYVYLEENLSFPFMACCTEERIISPLPKGAEIEVLGLAPSEECQHEMFVTMPWENREFGVPLSQLKPFPDVDKRTRQAVEDWLYWVRRR